jgi:DNA-binding transcriptional regulator GbsR (MarR family)
MSPARLPEAARRLVDFLGELGPRWGLPEEACRVHGYLYLSARPVDESELAEALALDAAATSVALAWLADYRLAARLGQAAWRTDSDPWELMMRALEQRRRREIGPALEILRTSYRTTAAEPGASPVVARQIGKLLMLAEDLAAIDVQAQRLSPAALRRMIGLGGRAARFMDRALGQGSGGRHDR